jgi:uncharacterized membrane protein YqjE
MPQTEPGPDGPAKAFRRMAGTILAILQNRLELAGVELHESKLRFIEALMLAMAVFFLAAMALVFLSLTLVAVFWDYRIYVLSALGLAFLLGSGILVFSLKKRIRGWPSPFASTIHELQKDRECLSPRK